MKMRALAIFAAAAALAAACSPPKYVTYKSVSSDFTVAAPWGWNAVSDNVSNGFSQVTFVGPVDIDFYLGQPTLSVRWYKDYQPHRLRDGSFEMYSNSNDFIKQTLDDVYGKNAYIYGRDTFVYGMTTRIAASLDSRPAIDRKAIPEIALDFSGLPAKHFAVLSPTRASPGVTIGTVVDRDGTRLNQRYHEYAVVPIEDPETRREAGFYVLCYPATLAGHDKGMKFFLNLIGTFHPLTAGPGGPKIKVPGHQAAKS